MIGGVPFCANVSSSLPCCRPVIILISYEGDYSALPILTLTEFVVRRSLKTTEDQLAGLYPGNPKQATSRPTTERLLRAFDNITLTCIQMPGQFIRHITPLSQLQTDILVLLDLPPSIYSELDFTLEHNPP